MLYMKVGKRVSPKFSQEKNFFYFFNFVSI